MERTPIAFDQLRINACRVWSKDWLLLCSGIFSQENFNMMTVAWGSIGIMWGKPFAQVVVRPSRHTYTFMEEFDTFTLSLFPPSHKKVLKFCGSHSGRDTDKVAGTGIHPIMSETVASPGFDEAELIIECRKIYFNDLQPEHFLAEDIQESYPESDVHRLYFGEISHISGIDKYQTP